MLLAEPGHTPYDLHLKVLGFPVRVHPLFWVMGLIMGFGGVMEVFIATAVAFVSILVHELGHAFPLKGILPIPYAVMVKNLGDAQANLNLLILFNMLLWFNLVWGAINLLPVFPLDGGQIAQTVMVAKDPWGGLARSLWVSVFTGAVAAVAGGFIFSSLYMVMLFGSLAYSSYLALQQIGGGGRGRPW
ncbi:MAG: site-2 protease family protein [Planctomycetales bacterium]|nr:site-2 protease family protein [Planctomycetales bacterium]